MIMSEIVKPSSEKVISGGEILNEQIGEMISQMAEELRGQSNDNVDLWRKLPNLALQVDGSGGYSEWRQTIYRDGLLKVGDAFNESSRTHLYVDCATGNILQAHSTDEEGNFVGYLASDKRIMSAWLADNNSFNADYWFDKFSNDAAREHSPVSHENEETVKIWRKKVAKSLGLKAIFSR